MRRLPLLFITLLTFAGVGFAQNIGDTEEAVVRDLGEPNLTREVGARKILMFSDGTKVVLEGGVVVEASGGSSGGSSRATPREVRAGEPSRVRPASTRSPEQPRRSSTREGRAGRGPASPGAILFVVLGVLVVLVCNVFYIIAAFSESILWGLGVLFVPFVSIVFLVLYWDRVRKPFWVSLLVGLPMVFLGGLIQAV
ncbi:MAG: hypothetical protein IPL39_24780 [Opitutaceae bacterium]|nr:hypothetical protein [Opitutaceae bacterium]